MASKPLQSKVTNDQRRMGFVQSLGEQKGHDRGLKSEIITRGTFQLGIG